MFHTVLVANRGEIARRVIRTLARLGVRSAAVYTPPDRGAPWTREADAALPVGSYLSIEEVVGAARAAGADALHPGYGFLSENAGLARACARAGVVFVGPSPAAIELMGDKVRAKAAAEAAGVPVVPGYNEAQARAAAEDYPLLVKAAAGGGGRGMRVVASPAGLDAALAAARREAQAGFGDDRVFIERFLPRARHLEVQVIGDAAGTVLALGERECSLQRRHQKVLEEAPSPVVSAELRATLYAEAVALASATGYAGAGTVEFIADAADPATHYFLEMNARLQVEHPVTELVTGLDLVELQLRVAAGEPLGLAQDDVVLRGHAIEARVNAEDLAFLPSAGTVLAFERPAGARVDAAIEAGSVVGTAYDSLIAKVVAHGPDRASALARLDHALAHTAILGLHTNVGFLRTLLAREDVRAGVLDTGLIERLDPVTAPFAAEAVARAAAALALAAAAAGDDPFARTDGWRLGAVRAPSYWTLAVDGERVEVVLDAGDDTLARRAWTAAGDWLGTEGWTWHVTRPSAEDADAGHADGDLRAPMPGQVLLVAHALGDAVAAGEAVVVLESMKMELSLVAPMAGTLSALSVGVGDMVTRDQVVATVQAS